MDHSKDNRGSELVAVTVTFLVFTILSVFLRCYVRGFITKEFKADDWLMVASLAIFILFGSFILVGVQYGLGKHNKSLPQNDEIQALKYQALAALIYIANMAFIKLSIAVFLLRIAVQRRYQWILKISMAIVAIWTAGIFLFDLFECKPVEFQWDYTIQGGICVSGDSLVNAAYAFSVLSVLSDWLYALLPIFMLWSVKMNRQTKFAVIVILSLGIFASIATLIRIKYLIDLGLADDILYASTDTLLWTIVEPGLGITAASVVTLRPLLRAFRIPGFSSAHTAPSSHLTPNPNSVRRTPNPNLEAGFGDGIGREFDVSEELAMDEMLGRSDALSKNPGGGSGSGSSWSRSHDNVRDVRDSHAEILNGGAVRAYSTSENGSQEFILMSADVEGKGPVSVRSDV